MFAQFNILFWMSYFDSFNFIILMKSIIYVLLILISNACHNAKTQNNASTQFTKNTNQNMQNNLDTATFGGGCYWCLEAFFQRLDGIVKVESGFSGGQTAHPTYKEVCTGTTGHAEVIQVVFDSTKIPFSELLKVFFTMHDPTTLNQQGNDIGTQYRSVIFYHHDEQKNAANSIINALNTAKVYHQPIVTEVTLFSTFYKAASYHQNYYNENSNESYCRFVIQPKLEKFEKIFKDYLKQ